MRAAAHIRHTRRKAGQRGGNAVAKQRWKGNTIYISQRLREELRPIDHCALTTVVAPMGYGKTTAVS